MPYMFLFFDALSKYSEIYLAKYYVIKITSSKFF